MSSLHVVIEVVILRSGVWVETKNPRQVISLPAGDGASGCVGLWQIEFFSPTNCGAPAAYSKLGIDAFGVRAHGIQRDRELPGDLGAGQVSLEQSQHLQFAIGERIGQTLARLWKRNHDLAKAINYMLHEDGRWDAFTRFLDDGRICLTNNAAERALRGVALGRKAWLFAGSSRGGDRAAFMYSLIVTAKMNDVDPQAWLADVLARLPDMPLSRLPDLLPWNWPRTAQRIAA